MSIFDHNIYENIRTRAIALHRDCVLMIPPDSNADNAASTLPGGGLCPHESPAESRALELAAEVDRGELGIETVLRLPQPVAGAETDDVEAELEADCLRMPGQPGLGRLA